VAKGALVSDPAGLSDEVLALRIQAGERDLIEELVARHSARLRHLILRLVRSPATADDLLQDTWVQVVRKFRQYDPRRPFAPWITRIALNRCRDHHRRERFRRLWRGTSSAEEADVTQRIPDDSPADPEAAVIVDRALATLSARHREVVVLKFYSGLTHAEIAEVLGIPSATVKTRLHHALKRLRRHFAPEGGRG
jgi:RNA polymerase sigma-70 factor (ECF subfamily)